MRNWHFQILLILTISKISGSRVRWLLRFWSFGGFEKVINSFANATKMIEYDDYIKKCRPKPDKASKGKTRGWFIFRRGFEYDDFKHWDSSEFLLVMRKKLCKLQRYCESTEIPLCSNGILRIWRLIYCKNYKFLNQVSLRVSNLTDENYYELRYQPMYGRFTSLRYTYNF